jgi:hypothetical protein
MEAGQRETRLSHCAIEDRHHSDCAKATVDITCFHIHLHGIRLKRLVCMLHVVFRISKDHCSEPS